MVDRETFAAALDALRQSVAEADAGDREDTIGDFLALASVLLVDYAGVDAAAARLRREADEIEAEVH